MKTNDVYTAYVSWPGGGKRRPVLILGSTDDEARVFKITTKYSNKSEYIKLKYYQINDLESAGLNRTSYIDTNTKMDLPKKKINFRHIGQLSTRDIVGLSEFINKN